MKDHMGSQSRGTPRSFPLGKDLSFGLMAWKWGVGMGGGDRASLSDPEPAPRGLERDHRSGAVPATSRTGDSLAILSSMSLIHTPEPVPAPTPFSAWATCLLPQCALRVLAVHWGCR